MKSKRTAISTEYVTTFDNKLSSSSSNLEYIFSDNVIALNPTYIESISAPKPLINGAAQNLFLLTRGILGS